MEIGVAIIGSGIFVRNEHLPAVQAAPHLKLRAIYSRSLKSAKDVGGGLPGIDLYSNDSGEGKSYEDLLKRDDVKAVIIALPITVQPSFIRAALEAGKHVLAEKPLAKDVATASELLNWYNGSIDQSKASFGIAENFRYQDSLIYAAEQVKQLGKVQSFRTIMNGSMKPGNQWFETTWRKTPEYQGGFLLDAGVHFIAGTRLLLGEKNALSRVSAFTTLLQPFLPPVDTVDASFKTSSGISGTVSMSFGSSFREQGYAVACENGTVKLSCSKVIVNKDGREEVKEFPSEGDGVKQEVKAWAEGLAAGKPNTQQSPEEALRDLEILEAMLKSGDQNGMPIDIRPA